MRRLILAILAGAAFGASSAAYAAVKTVVLVQVAFADGSGWKPIADILVNHGYSVSVVQEPDESDVASTRRVLDKAGPCVLVGHSYGGMIITEAGSRRAGGRQSQRVPLLRDGLECRTAFVTSSFPRRASGTAPSVEMIEVRTTGSIADIRRLHRRDAFIKPNTV